MNILKLVPYVIVSSYEKLYVGLCVWFTQWPTLRQTDFIILGYYYNKYSYIYFKMCIVYIFLY